MVELLGVGSQFAAFLSAFVALVALGSGLRTYRRQANAQVFLEYTGRYQRTMESFPSSARRARFDLEAPPPPPSEDLTLAVLRYLNLCSEEFYLCTRGYLSKDVWAIWEAELRRTLRSPLVRREWQSLRGEFESYPEFVQYVDAS